MPVKKRRKNVVRGPGIKRRMRERTERKILEAILDFKQKHGESPTQAEIAAKIGVTEGHVSRLIRDLKKRGNIKSDGKRLYVIKLPEALAVS